MVEPRWKCGDILLRSIKYPQTLPDVNLSNARKRHRQAGSNGLQCRSGGLRRRKTQLVDVTPAQHGLAQLLRVIVWQAKINRH